MTAPLPSGFAWHDRGTVRIAARPADAEGVGAALAAGPEAVLAGSAGPAPGAGGRGGVARIVLPGGTAAVLRKLRRGGLAGRVLPDRFAGPGRAVEELRVSVAARAAGLPVAETIAVVINRGGGLVACYVLTRAVEAASSLAEALAGADGATAEALLRDVAALVRRCHDAGLVHGDLNLTNILVSDALDVPGGGTGGGGGGSRELTVIDLDRARFHEGGARQADRFANLSRLARSHDKMLGATGGWSAGPDGAIGRLVGAYAAGDGALAAALSARIPAHRRAMRFHRIAWKLFSVAALGSVGAG